MSVDTCKVCDTKRACIGCDYVVICCNCSIVTEWILSKDDTPSNCPLKQHTDKPN